MSTMLTFLILASLMGLGNLREVSEDEIPADKDGKPLFKMEDERTIKNCYDFSDIYKGIQCFAVMKINGLISEEVADKGIRFYVSKFPPEEVMLAIGITNKWGIKMGLVYDPHGKIVGINWRTLRWGKPSRGVIHQKDTKPIVFAYSWKAVEETPLINHWSSYTALTGVKGFHLAYANDGSVSGVKEVQSFRKGCTHINKAMRNNADYYSHVTVFMPPDEVCFETSDKYDIIVGDYHTRKTLLDGYEVEAYVPKWECKIGSKLVCVGRFDEETQAQLIKLASLNE